MTLSCTVSMPVAWSISTRCTQIGRLPAWPCHKPDSVRGGCGTLAESAAAGASGVLWWLDTVSGR
jgi:hypothetical protein